MPDENSMLPRISMSDLQRSAKSALAGIRDYAVIQRHGEDLAFVLHPRLGRILLESGMLEMLRQKSAAHDAQSAPTTSEMDRDMTDLIGNVLRELSKK